MSAFFAIVNEPESPATVPLGPLEQLPELTLHVIGSPVAVVSYVTVMASFAREKVALELGAVMLNCVGIVTMLAGALTKPLRRLSAISYDVPVASSPLKLA